MREDPVGCRGWSVGGVEGREEWWRGGELVKHGEERSRHPQPGGMLPVQLATAGAACFTRSSIMLYYFSLSSSLSSLYTDKNNHLLTIVLIYLPTIRLHIIPLYRHACRRLNEIYLFSNDFYCIIFKM